MQNISLRQSPLRAFLMPSLWAMALAFLCSGALAAQGPPILIDKPIMLGAHKGTLRTLAQYGDYHHLDYYALAIMGDYNLRNDLAIALTIPVAFEKGGDAGLGDLMLEAKYQFLRKDGMGKTFRVSAKGAATFATGQDEAATMLFGMGTWQTFAGIVAGYESLQLGLVSELGYRTVGGEFDDNLSYKLTFGIPFLAPAYPVKQVTFYGEFSGVTTAWENEHALFAAPGIQYALGPCTYEFSYQFPLYQKNIPLHHVNNKTFFIGWRIVL